MPITITISVDSVAEFQQHIKDFARSWNQLQDSPSVGPKLIINDGNKSVEKVQTSTSQEVVDEQPSAIKKRGRKAKEVEPVQEPAPSEVIESINQSSETAAVSSPQVPPTSDEPSQKTHQEQAKEEKLKDSGASIPTKEAAAKALRNVSERLHPEDQGKALLVCREILNRFDARKISELTDDKIPAMIEMCNKVIATGSLD